MVKDAQRYKSTGGWGYDHFERDDKTSRLRMRAGDVRRLSREGAGGPRVQSHQTVRLEPIDKRYHPHA